MKRRIGLVSGLILLGLAVALGIYLAKPPATPTASQLPGLSGETASGFARVQPGQTLSFPDDHGPHPDYQTEWWYYTGNLEASSPNQRHFGYQLTFFRRALLPAAERTSRASRWAADQIYLAHFALTDVKAESYHAFERFARGAVDLAGAQSQPYRVWLEDWHAQETTDGATRLQARQGAIAIDLHLTDAKGPVLQGLDGYSQKGPDSGNASMYYSLTRLAISGAVTTEEGSFQVTGLGWMDHEFSTSALSPEQTGWDWFALQLSDTSELMVFHIRRADGSVDPFSSGTFVAPHGWPTRLGREDFVLAVTDTWRSPRSGAVYPSGWTLDVPQLDLSLRVRPYLRDQELNVSYTYWEGAASIEGERAGQPVQGSGYVELTGYAASMQRQF
jgi:predicted secreted hydrolase